MLCTLRCYRRLLKHWQQRCKIIRDWLHNVKHVPHWLISFISQSKLSWVFSHTYVRTFCSHPSSKITLSLECCSQSRGGGGGGSATFYYYKRIIHMQLQANEQCSANTYTWLFFSLQFNSIYGKQQYRSTSTYMTGTTIK